MTLVMVTQHRGRICHYLLAVALHKDAPTGHQCKDQKGNDFVLHFCLRILVDKCDGNLVLF
jgi:hypothetical protein